MSAQRIGLIASAIMTTVILAACGSGSYTTVSQSTLVGQWHDDASAVLTFGTNHELTASNVDGKILDSGHAGQRCHGSGTWNIDEHDQSLVHVKFSQLCDFAGGYATEIRGTSKQTIAFIIGDPDDHNRYTFRRS